MGKKISRLGYLVLANDGNKHLIDKVFNLGSCLGSQVASDGILGKWKLGPDDEMYNTWVYSVWPVIVEDLPVSWITEWRPLWCQIRPEKTIVDNEWKD